MRSQSAWIPGLQRDLNHAVNEFALCARVRFASRRVGGISHGRQLHLEHRIFLCYVGVLTQKVAECQRAPFLFAAELNNMEVMGVWPFPGPVKEGTEAVVSVWYMNVANSAEWICVSTDRLQVFDGDLNVDDWLCCESRNSR